MAKKIALGINDFKVIIEGEYAFVDKTLLIKEFLQTSAHVTLVPRPRRFGKTLNLSMLKYFCEKPTVERPKQSDKHLFNNLKITRHADVMAEQGQYPVIFLTF